MQVYLVCQLIEQRLLLNKFNFIFIKRGNELNHSKNFDKVKKYYNSIHNGKRLWNENRVRNAVEKKWITKIEYKEITGNDYQYEIRVIKRAKTNIIPTLFIYFGK